MNGDGPVPLHQVLLLVLLLLIPLIQGLLPALRRRLEELAREAGAHLPEDDAEPEMIPLPLAAEPAEPAALPTPARARRRARDDGASVRPEEPKRRRRPRMDATDARRAIVAMAVFGPCRGWEPPRTPRGAEPGASPRSEP